MSKDEKTYLVLMLMALALAVIRATLGEVQQAGISLAIAAIFAVLFVAGVKL